MPIDSPEFSERLRRLEEKVLFLEAENYAAHMTIAILVGAISKINAVNPAGLVEYLEEQIDHQIRPGGYQSNYHPAIFDALMDELKRSLERMKQNIRTQVGPNPPRR